MLKHTFAAALLGIAMLCAIPAPAHAEEVIVTRRHPVAVREYVTPAVPVRHYVYAPSYYTYDDPYYVYAPSYYSYPRYYARPGFAVNYYGHRHHGSGFSFGFRY